METADSLAFVEPPEKVENLNEVQISTLVQTVQTNFSEASRAKERHEHRMITAYNNFRGIYGKTIAFRSSEKSRVFVKITKTKVLAGFGQVADIVLGGEKFPVGVRSTEIPEGVEEIVHPTTEVDALLEQVKGGGKKEEEEQYDPYDVGFEGDDKILKPGATFGRGIFKKLMGGEKDTAEDNVSAGPSPLPGGVQITPAKQAAERMEKLIHDQLEESDAGSEMSKALFEMVLLGTGIIKGPFTDIKTLHKWVKDQDGKRSYSACYVKIPRVEFVSVWDAYPDPNATCKAEMSYFIHRHRMSASQLRALGKKPLFNKEEIRLCVDEDPPNYTKQSFEHDIHSSMEEASGRDFHDRYEVLEYWGVMGKSEAEAAGLDTSQMEDLDEVQVNAWVCGQRVLRVVSNPFQPMRIPYHIFNFEVNPYSIFGVGIAENMDDSQQIMNGHARMAIDNLALSGGLVFDIDESALVPGQSMEMYNGKIFRRQAGQPGQAVYGIKFPNTTQENLFMFDKFRQVADEETGIPSYAHGQTGVQTTTRTASGISMLLGASSLSNKTVIKNIDRQLLKPLGKDLFHWNMQFFEGDLDVRGDLEVKALGMDSLMQKEVRSQRLTTFLQTVLNPALAPYVRIPYIVEELAKSLDLDKKLILNDTQEQRFSAELLGLSGYGQAVSGQPQGGDQQSAGAVGPDGVLSGTPEQGSTGNGGGTIGTGDVPSAGQDEFSAPASA